MFALSLLCLVMIVHLLFVYLPSFVDDRLMMMMMIKDGGELHISIYVHDTTDTQTFTKKEKWKKNRQQQQQEADNKIVRRCTIRITLTLIGHFYIFFPFLFCRILWFIISLCVYVHVCVFVFMCGCECMFHSFIHSQNPFSIEWRDSNNNSSSINNKSSW